MSEPEPNGKRASDPFEQWRNLRDACVETWAKTLNEAVKSDAYAQATGMLLDTALTTSAPMREVLQKTMLTALEQLNMPTREDFISLAERLTNIEVRLDDMDIKLDRIEASLSHPAPQPAKRTPRRTAKKGTR